MAYEKRLCVLKQIKRGFSADGSNLSGVIHAERLGEELTLTVRVLGIAPVREGRYALCVKIAEKTFCFDLSGNETLKASGAPSLKNGFSALICFIRGEADPIAFGTCGTASADYSGLITALTEVKEKRKRAIPVPMPPNQIPGAPSPQVPLTPAVPLPDREERIPYNDEAIADANYFGGDDERKDDENEASSRRNHGQKEKEAAENSASAHEESVHPFENTERKLTYYNEIRDRIEEAFRLFPKDDSLLGIFPCSEWVRKENVLIGIIYEEGLPKYLCVAAEAEGEQPEQMQDQGIFVPKTHFSDKDGYYVLFQDADTGEIVRVFES